MGGKDEGCSFILPVGGRDEGCSFISPKGVQGAGDLSTPERWAADAT